MKPKIEKLGISKTNNREVYYISTSTVEWYDLLPDDNWLVLPIVDRKETELINFISNACLKRNVRYICTLGKECEYVHDSFDETILIRRIKNNLPFDSPDDFEYEPMTTWHNNFEEGFWFGLIVAFDDNFEIDKVVCLDLTNDYKETIRELLGKINSGWLPD